MDMKKIKRFVLLLIMAFLAVNVQAQLEQAVKNIFAGDTIATHPVPLHRDSDSVRVANLQKSLEEARLNEANMRLEMEEMKLQMFAADSVRYPSNGNGLILCANSLKECLSLPKEILYSIFLQNVEDIPLNSVPK